MTPARILVLGAFLLVLPHLALGDGDALPLNADKVRPPLVDCYWVAGAYEYGAVGGMVAWSSRAFLLRGAQYKYERTHYRNPQIMYLEPQIMTASCSPDIPPCTAGAGVTSPMINKAFAHRDVQAAFESKSPIFY